MHVYLNRYTTDNSSLIYYTLGHSSYNVSQKKSVQYFIRFYRAVALFFFITSTSQSKFLFVFFFLTHPLQVCIVECYPKNSRTHVQVYTIRII